MNNKITIKDVAKKAEVSPSTVSLVLSGKGNISEDVRNRVYEAAKQLDYIKPVHASSIAVKHISHIAILVCEDYEKAFEWNFIRHMLINLESEITKKQYYPVIIPVSFAHEPNKIMEKIVLSKAGAVLSIHYGNPELFQQLETQEIPVVLINNSQYQDQFYTVCADVVQGAYKATKYLLSLGHTQIALADYHRPDMPGIVHDVFLGFKKALEEEEVTFPESDRITVNLYNEEELHEKLHRVFHETHHPPTALLAHDDYFAARIFSAFHHLNIQVPADVSLTALGDTLDYNQSFIPKITTVRLNNDLLGKIAGEMILQRLQNNHQKEIDVLKVNYQLEERESCRLLLSGA